MVPGRGFKRFPLPMVLGTDLCRINRIAGILDRKTPDPARFIRRVLTEEEIRDAWNPYVKRWIEGVVSKNTKDMGAKPKFEDYLRELERTSIFLAGRWAAKEAVIKAHPHRRLNFRDIIISTSESLARHVKEEREKEEKEAEGDDIIANPDDNGMAKKEVEEEVIVNEKEYGLEKGRPGRPVAIVRGRKEIGEEDAEVLISISHDGAYASAVCLSWVPMPRKHGVDRARGEKSKKGKRGRLVEGAGFA